MDLEIHNNEIDNYVDEDIFNCLSLQNPKSFFLFAGAGSGKTRSLVNVLTKIQEQYGEQLRRNRQQVAIITYTNAACNEIRHRLKHNSLFAVSTIHSFIWELIKPYNTDIKDWLKKELVDKISDLKDKESKGRGNNKASAYRLKEIDSKTKRLQGIDKIRQFTYNPNGDSQSKDSLNHADVIKLGAFFLIEKQLMQAILVRKYPILLIDESQDTKKELIDAFFKVQETNKSQFSLGLFGDTMQRIYSDGKENLGKNLPNDWLRPAKRMNHRCPKRVITLINKIRENIDKQEQLSRTDKEEGTVRFFIIPNSVINKREIEDKISKRMKEITLDGAWNGLDADVKILTLEHHMAANRMGFLEFFEALYNSEKLRTGLLDGTLPGIKLFTQIVLPIIKAKQKGDEFMVAKIVKENSPLFEKKHFKQSKTQQDIIKSANEGINSLLSLWTNGNTPKLIDVILNLYESKLFSLPVVLASIASRSEEEQKLDNSTLDNEEYEENSQDTVNAWEQALLQSFDQIEAYSEYISDNSRFGTHQGVKGLEFPRVMVIIDDSEARGFLFSYEKLFGAKLATDTDIHNEKEGKDTSYGRTLRLFYVACSRAIQSLAIVAYTSDPKMVAKTIIENGWFKKEEIEFL